MTRGIYQRVMDAPETLDRGSVEASFQAADPETPVRDYMKAVDLKAAEKVYRGDDPFWNKIHETPAKRLWAIAKNFRFWGGRFRSGMVHFN